MRIHLSPSIGLGTAFLGERVLRQYSRSERGPNPQICAVAVEKRPNHGSAQVMEKVICPF